MNPCHGSTLQTFRRTFTASLNHSISWGRAAVHAGLGQASHNATEETYWLTTMMGAETLARFPFLLQL